MYAGSLVAIVTPMLPDGGIDFATRRSQGLEIRAWQREVRG